MTPEQLKELAEFATEFLPWLDNIDEQKLFYDGTYSPALMHLAQEVLEREGLRWHTDCVSTGDGKMVYACRITGVRTQDSIDIFKTHKNKFIAFWEATRQAKGGK